MGIGSVETDMPLSLAAGRLGEAGPAVSGVACELVRLSFCLEDAPWLAIVCRMVRWGVLVTLEGCGDGLGEGCGAGVTTGPVLGLR